MELRAERARVLASNLANESTPGYEARDIDFATSLQQLQEREQAQAAGEADLLDLDGGPELKYRVPTSPSQDGNTVELGVEQAQFSQNASDYQVSAEFVSMQVRSLKQAIQGQ